MTLTFDCVFVAAGREPSCFAHVLVTHRTACAVPLKPYSANAPMVRFLLKAPLYCRDLLGLGKEIYQLDGNSTRKRGEMLAAISFRGIEMSSI